MIGMCAGLALSGCTPFAYTIATFAIYRPFEFVRDDLCYQNLPVTVVGMGGGVIYSMLGGTHHSQEDVAIISALPNMPIIAPCDPLGMRRGDDAGAHGRTNGPVYLRIGKAGEPVLTAERRAVAVRQTALPAARHRYLHHLLWRHHEDGARSRRRARRQGRSVSRRLGAHAEAARPRRHRRGPAAATARSIVIEEHAPQGGLARRPSRSPGTSAPPAACTPSP